MRYNVTVSMECCSQGIAAMSSSCSFSRAISRGVRPFAAAAFSVHTIIFHQTFDNVQVTTGTSESFSFLFHTTHFLSNILPPRSNHFSIAPCTLGTSFSMAVFRVGIKKHTHILPPSIWQSENVQRIDARHTIHPLTVPCRHATYLRNSWHSPNDIVGW